MSSPIHIGSTNYALLNLLQKFDEQFIHFTWSGTVRTHVDQKTWNVFWDYSVAGIAYIDVAEKYGIFKSEVFKYQKRVINRLKAVALERINDEGPLEHE